MLVNEIFLSIQGESSYVGVPCVFIRLAGCNLNCTWCDTPYARVEEGATEFEVEDVVARAVFYKTWLVEITGGEPMTQPDTPRLVNRLLEEGLTVMIETNGSASLSGLDKRAIKIVDVKCPGSGQCGSFKRENLDELTPQDEIKFVISNTEDYEFAKKFITEYIKDSTQKILFAPVAPDLPPSSLAEWILKDGLKVRLNLQIHRYIWGDVRGK